MAPRPRAGAKAKAKAKAVAKAAAALKVARQGHRRQAVKDLNALARELGARPVPVKTVGKKVQKLIRTLQGRCADAATADRL